MGEMFKEVLRDKKIKILISVSLMMALLISIVYTSVTTLATLTIKQTSVKLLLVTLVLCIIEMVANPIHDIITHSANYHAYNTLLNNFITKL